MPRSTFAPPARLPIAALARINIPGPVADFEPPVVYEAPGAVEAVRRTAVAPIELSAVTGTREVAFVGRADDTSPAVYLYPRWFGLPGRAGNVARPIADPLDFVEAQHLRAVHLGLASIETGEEAAAVDGVPEGAVLGAGPLDRTLGGPWSAPYGGSPDGGRGGRVDREVGINQDEVAGRPRYRRFRLYKRTVGKVQCFRPRTQWSQPQSIQAMDEPSKN